jgi:hypothetical protein
MLDMGNYLHDINDTFNLAKASILIWIHPVFGKICEITVPRYFSTNKADFMSFRQQQYVTMDMF